MACDRAKKVVFGINYDGKGTQVNAHRTDYLGFTCNWPHEDGYSMSCRHKQFPKKQIHLETD